MKSDPLEKLLAVVIDHRGKTPKKLGGDFVGFGVPVLSARHISGGQIVARNELRFVSPQMYAKWMPIPLQRGDVLLTSEAPLGELFWLKDKTEYVLGQRLFALRPDPTKIDPGYLYYFLKTSQGQAALHGRASGSTVQGIRQSELLKVEIELPDTLNEQRGIAAALRSLDDRINHNRALATNLEAIVRRLFKSWFVDFDPVRAKAVGEKPAGRADDIAVLFPDRFVDSELEEVPEGWKVGALGDVCELNPETWSTRKHPEILQYIDLSNVKFGCIEEATSYLWDESPSRARRVLRCGDTIVGTVRPGNRSFALIATDGLTGSTGFAVLRPSYSHHREYLYLAATSDDAIERLAHLADGAAYPAVRPDVVTGAEIVIPNDEIMRQFSVITCPMFDQIAVCQSESSALSSLRDLLLPRLISGKLRVADAETLIEEAIA